MLRYLFIQLFRVYVGHHMGIPLMRWLLLTNYAMYLLVIKNNWHRSKLETEKRRKEGSSSSHDDLTAVKIQKYNAVKVVPLSQLDYISVCL